MFLAGGRGKSILSEGCSFEVGRCRRPQFFVGVRPEHGISTIQSAQVTALHRAIKLSRTCVLLYIPKVISLSGWLLRGDASTFQYYFSKPIVSNVSMELNNP